MSAALGAVDPEVWLACGYAGFLLVVAYLLDLAARRVSSHNTSLHHGGFTYHEDHDAWRCPQDQLLWPQSFDPENRVMRYRGNPLVCNACPVKESCTSSDHGREIQRNVDTWPASEAERFHRGIACAVVVLGMAWPLAMLLTGRTATETLVLLGSAGLVAAGSWPLWSHLRRSPAAFPEHVPAETLDEAALSRAAQQDRERRRRTTYGSDRRVEAGNGAGSDEWRTRWQQLEQQAQNGEHEGDLPEDLGWSRRRIR